MNRQEIHLDISAARMRVEEAEGLGAKGVKYPGVQQREDDRLSEARRNLAELLEEKERNDARLARDEERLAKARRDETLLEKSPEAAAFDAWQRAIAKREVAEQLGHSGDVPTIEEIDVLRAAHEKAKLDAIAPANLRLEAIREEYERALHVVRDLQQRLHDLLQPYAEKWRAAAEEQLSTAVKLISQTQQLKSLLAEDGDVHDAFSFPRIDSTGFHRGDPRIAGDDSMRDVYLAMRASSREMSRSLGT
ncbi:hypothetical protein AB3G45_10635 [Shinella sp. S4-D37]|uniref:hypothetical protein n=1 Tax=Shinella sp. S4-D37 TaxID=3161999 RepID=UPI003465AEBC